MKNIAVIGLPRSGTSVMWHTLAHDPEVEQALYEPLRESVLVPGAIEKTWDGDLDEQRAVIARAYSPAFQFMPVTVPSGTCVEALDEYLHELFYLGTTCVKLIQMPLRAGSFARSAGLDFKIVWIVRSPFQFAASMMPNPNAWTDQGYREWMETFELAGIGGAATFDTVYRLKQEHPYIRMLNLWRLHVEHMLTLQQDPAVDVVRVRLEDFVREPQKEIQKIYGAGCSPPRAVVDRVREDGHPDGWKWSRAVSVHNVEAHAPWVSEKWRGAISLAGIEDLIRRMGYPIP